MSLPSIILDTDKTTPIYELPLKIRQGDTGDELQVTLGKSFEKYTDLSTVDVELIAKTPDQRLIKQAVTDKSGNTFKVNFPDEMYTNVGVFRNMYFKVGDDSTSSVKLVVLQGIGSIKEAGSYIDDFETLVKEAESYVLALKDFSDTGNAKIDNKVAELTGKMTDFVDKSKEDLDAAKAAWSTFQSNSETAFTDAQDKRTSDFDSQKAGFETDFSEQKTDFENRFKALLATLQGDYDDFKNLINKDVADFNTSLDSLDSRYDAIKAQLDALKVPEIGGVNLLKNTTADVKTASSWDNHYYKGPIADLGLSVGNPIIYSAFLDNTNARITRGSSYVIIDFYDADAQKLTSTHGNIIDHGTSGTSSAFVRIPDRAVTLDLIERTNNQELNTDVGKRMLERGMLATDWAPAPEDVQTAITSALDKIAEVDSKLADYSTSSEVDNKISTGVGQAKTYAEQSIKKIIGAAPDTLDTIEELADAVTKNKDGVQAINEGITKKADKTDVTALQNTVQTMITSISQEDYDALVSAGTVDPKILYVIPDA